VWKVASQAPLEMAPADSTTLEGVFEWACTWLWKDLRWQGDCTRLPCSIRSDDCMVVADRSFQPNVQTDLCLTAFFFECTAGRGRLVGSFADFLASANAYQGELLGLMAAHLILCGEAELHPALGGRVRLYSDCAGALDKLENLPPQRLPAKCKHLDILKNILLHCKNLPFKIISTHIPAHHDDNMDFRLLSQPAQLNCVVDAGAKKCLLEAVVHHRQFRLEPIACFVGKEKITADTSGSIRFWAHCRLA
jgi:hypothetical protein